MNAKKRQRMDDLIIALATNPSASLNELAEAAGIGKTTLYRLGGARESLVEKAVSYAVAKLSAILDEFVFDARHIRPLLVRLAQRSIDEGASILLLVACCHLNISALSQLEQRWHQTLDTFFLQAQQEGLLRIDISASALTETWGALMSGLIFSEQQGRMTKAEVVDTVEKVFFQGALAQGKA